MRRRRSKIKLISAFFIVIAPVLLIKIAIPILTSKQSIKFDIAKSDIGKNTFSDFSYKTQDAQGRDVTVTSDKVSEEKKGNYVFEKMKSSFVLPNGEAAEISADVTKAVNVDKTVCEFIGNVKLVTNAGLSMESERAFADFNKKIITGDDNISITKNGSNFSGNSFLFNINEHTLTLTGEAKGYSEGQKRKVSAEKMVIQFFGNDIKNLDATGDPSFVSPEYELYAKESIVYGSEKILAESDVRLLYKKEGKNFDIKSDKMNATLDEKSSIKEVFASGNLRVKVDDAIIHSDNGVFKNDKIVATGNVMISKAQGEVFGEVAELNVSTGDIVVKKSSGIVGDSKEK